MFYVAALLLPFTMLLFAVPRAATSTGLQPSAPPRVGLDLQSAAAGLPDLRSLVVSRGGEVVGEYYAARVRPDGLANVKSASKSIIAILIGIALERKLIPDIEQPIATYFPELRRDPDPRKLAITVEDLLTMRSGLASTSGENYGPWVKSPNWVRFALRQPMVSEPGTGMQYSTGTSHLLSAILTRVSRTSTWQFAQDALFTPLGLRLARWPRDPQGIYFGGNEMLMTPRQMVAFGELYLNDGRVGDRQVIPKAWVESADDAVGRSRWGSDREYGHGFWIRDFAGHRSFYAWGYGGQFIFVIPSKDLVVVTTSRSDVSRERRDHLDAIYQVALDIVLMY
jgi:CubicO group peptidase (beta-lactamase class C family)